MGLGMSALRLPSAIWFAPPAEWRFPRSSTGETSKKALLAGTTVSAATAAMRAALSPVLSAVIQNAGWRSGYLVSAALIAAFNLPAVLFPFTLTPEESNLPPLGERKTETKIEPDAAAPVTVRRSLFCMAMAYGILTSFATAFPQHFPGLTGAYALPAVTRALTLSVLRTAPW